MIFFIYDVRQIHLLPPNTNHRIRALPPADTSLVPVPRHTAGGCAASPPLLFLSLFFHKKNISIFCDL